DLPTTRSRPRTRERKHEQLAVRLGDSTLSGVSVVASANAATSFLILVAAFGAVLARFSRQSHVVVGVPAPEQGRADGAAAEGRLLPLPVDVSGEPSFMDLVQRVKRETDDALRYGPPPLARLVEELGPSDAVRSRLPFEAVFTV